MGTSWWEIEVTCTPELEEASYWRLERFGCRGTATTELHRRKHVVRTYVPQLQAKLLDLSALALWLEEDAAQLGLPAPVTVWNLIDDEDWARSWQKYWEPLEIGDCFLICPAWLTPPETRRTVLMLDPGAAFGTGTHPTTQLCLEGLEMRITPRSPGGVIADIGCGSGILGVASLLLGATQVYGVDTDPLAPPAAMENANLNEIPPGRLIAEEGSIARLIELVPQECDGILCNIIAEVVLELIPYFSELAKPKCWGVVSGILLEQADPVARQLEAHGWQIGTLWRKDGWCSFNIRRAA